MRHVLSDEPLGNFGFVYYYSEQDLTRKVKYDENKKM